MRASIIIAVHNEGLSLERTVRECIPALSNLDGEIVVVDDASTDGSVRSAARVSSLTRVIQHTERLGVAAAKDAGARAARGDVLVFLDGHCKPEAGSIEQLVHDVEQLNGQAVVAPRVADLDVGTWRNSPSHCGNGYVLDLESFAQSWVRLRQLRRRGRFYESPNLAGCCLALTRELYEHLGGFDRKMYPWGSEQVDFGLRAWFAGYRVVNDIEAVIGHRFQADFNSFAVSEPQILANELRMARRHFSNAVWDDWIERMRANKSSDLWESGWGIFLCVRASVDREREGWLAERKFDEFWYADRFDMRWPLTQDSASSFRRQLHHSHRSRPRRREAMRETPVVGHAVSDEFGRFALYLKTGRRQWGDVDIERSSFTASDDETAAYGSLLTEVVGGRTLHYAASLEAEDLCRRFGDRQGIARAQLAIDAIQAAVRRIKHQEESKSDSYMRQPEPTGA
jgi:GT2 family glycosyltransferase